MADKTARSGVSNDTGGPPELPTAAGAVITSGPPELPTAAAAVITGGPPEMPTAASAAVTGGPPEMPGSPRKIPSAASSFVSGPPEMATLAGPSLPSHAPPPVPSAASLPPGRYELGSEIARGGMGRVVDAIDTTLGRVVAFKEALTTDTDTLGRFQREIHITAQLEHPSIVPVHDAGTSSNGAPFYVMRKVSGRPLERLVASADTLGQRLALIPHIVDSAQAIAHAHQRGIVHRDIKPSNILIGELGETVVIDWGLAKRVGEPEDRAGKPQVDLSDSLKTRAGIVYGTPGFMAPEQLRGAPVDERCDVYALGATLYHLLSRKPPHYAKTADEMMKAAVAAGPTPIRELVEGVPPDLSTIVDKALAHDPTVRYQNARELAEDLQRFLTGQLVKSHHYSPREKLVRLIRKNRGVSAAVAALIIVGTISVVRIVVERNRADEAARQARHETQVAEHRTEQLTLTQARYSADQNPTRAVAMIKPLATKYWREVRAIAAAARATGVAWGVPASHRTLSLEMSRDGTRVLSGGDDGVVRLHDLARHTTRELLALGTPAMARFADDERQVVLWHDAQLVVLDPQTARRRDLVVSTPIADLEVVGTTAYWVDDQRALWQLDLASGAPTTVPLDEPVRALAPSPDGRWIALSGDAHLLLIDRTDPAAPPSQVTFGRTRQVAWAADSENLAALIDEQVLDVTTNPVPTIVHRQTVGNRQFVAHSGGRVYTIGPTGVAITSRTEVVGRRQLSGSPVGLVESRGGTVVAGATGGLVVMSQDGDRVLPLQAVRIEGVLASPHSPYVIAQLEDRLLVWNLDHVQPRRLTDHPTSGALFATGDQVIVGGTLDGPAQSIDVASGTAEALGDWQGLRAVATAGTGAGRVVALVDGARHVHLTGVGREPQDLPGDIDIAGFATDDRLVLATLDGAIYVHDVARGERSQLVQARSQLIGLAWGRGHHPWIAAAFVDGTLWRKNLATGVATTATRTPAFAVDRVAERDGKLIVGADGTVLFVYEREVHAWRADGTFARLARAPKLIDDFGEAGPGHVIAFTGDNTIYAIARDAPDQVTVAIPSIDGTSASMSPDTGLLVVLDHGAIDVIDPLVHQQWILAPLGGVPYANPVISPDGRRVLAQTANSLLAWSLDLPTTADATVAWLDAMTNAVADDQSPSGLSWP